MIANWDRAFAEVLKSEGGYVNDPDDRGQETNLGVTKRSWSDYLQRQILDGEMRSLTPEMVKPFYKTKYWDKCYCDVLPSGLDYMVFDFAVNAGVSRAIKFLQFSVAATPDGIIGPATLAAVASFSSSPKDLMGRFSKTKKEFYEKIVKNDPTQMKFFRGWMNRVTSVEKTAFEMV